MYTNNVPTTYSMIKKSSDAAILKLSENGPETLECVVEVKCSWSGAGRNCRLIGYRHRQKHWKEETLIRCAQVQSSSDEVIKLHC